MLLMGYEGQNLTTSNNSRICHTLGLWWIYHIDTSRTLLGFPVVYAFLCLLLSRNNDLWWSLTIRFIVSSWVCSTRADLYWQWGTHCHVQNDTVQICAVKADPNKSQGWHGLIIKCRLFLYWLEGCCSKQGIFGCMLLDEFHEVSIRSSLT